MNNGPEEFDYGTIVQGSAIGLAHPLNHLALARVIARDTPEAALIPNSQGQFGALIE